MVYTPQQPSKPSTESMRTAEFPSSKNFRCLWHEGGLLGASHIPFSCHGKTPIFKMIQTEVMGQLM
jgi:hypothetical protein